MWNDLKPPTVPLTRVGKVAWLMSFIDLLSIVLASFVLMFALKTVDMRQWRAVSGAFKETFSPVDAVVEVMPDGRLNARETRAPLTDGLRYLDSLMRRRLADDPRWGAGLRARFDPHRRWMDYTLPAGATEADWRRLAATMRLWDNQVELRVVAPAAEASQRLAAMGPVFRLLKDAGMTALTGVSWEPAGEAPGRTNGLILRVYGEQNI